jgi:hypothetical protein
MPSANWQSLLPIPTSRHTCTATHRQARSTAPLPRAPGLALTTACAAAKMRAAPIARTARSSSGWSGRSSRSTARYARRRRYRGTASRSCAASPMPGRSRPDQVEEAGSLVQREPAREPVSRRLTEDVFVGQPFEMAPSLHATHVRRRQRDGGDRSKRERQPGHDPSHPTLGRAEHDVEVIVHEAEQEERLAHHARDRVERSSLRLEVRKERVATIGPERRVRNGDHESPFGAEPEFWPPRSSSPNGRGKQRLRVSSAAAGRSSISMGRRRAPEIGNTWLPKPTLRRRSFDIDNATLPISVGHARRRQVDNVSRGARPSATAVPVVTPRWRFRWRRPPSFPSATRSSTSPPRAR